MESTDTTKQEPVIEDSEETKVEPSKLSQAQKKKLKAKLKKEKDAADALQRANGEE